MEGNASPRGNLAVMGVLIALGLIVGGWILGAEIKQTRLGDRYVSVKGLSERTVKSDLAIWTLGYKEAGDDLGPRTFRSNGYGGGLLRESRGSVHDGGLIGARRRLRGWRVGSGVRRPLLLARATLRRRSGHLLVLLFHFAWTFPEEGAAASRGRYRESISAWCRKNRRPAQGRFSAG